MNKLEYENDKILSKLDANNNIEKQNNDIMKCDINDNVEKLNAKIQYYKNELDVKVNIIFKKQDEN